jgi:hypothetical protein
VRVRFDRVTVSSVLFSLCLLILMSWSFKWAATWPTRVVWVMDRVGRLNYEASNAFAELALEIIALIVIWTSYQKRMRWSWFVMVVFVSVCFLPVYLLDVLLDVKRVGWQWWPAVVRDARAGRPFAVGALGEIAISTLMVIALLVPVGEFFGKKQLLPSGGQSK